LLDINTALSNVVSLSTSLTTVHANTIDGGNTASLLSSISNTSVTDGTLKAMLLSASPYLSDTVLKAYFTRGISSLDILDVHDTNKPVTNNVWNCIENLSLTPTVIENLEEQQAENVLSERRMLEDALGTANADLQFVYSEKLNYFLQDTLETALDSVLNLLVANTGKLPNAEIMRVNIYATAGAYTRAFAYADSLEEVDEYAELMVLQNTLLQLDTSIAGLNKILDDEDLYNVVSSYANDSGKQGHWLARSVMRHVYDGKSFDSITKPLVFEMNLNHLNPSTSGARPANPDSNFEEPTISVKLPHKNKTSVKIEKPLSFQNSFNLYPNPANENVFLLFTSKNTISCDYSIRDILGRDLLKGKLESGIANEVNTTGLVNGIYFVTLILGNQVVESKRIAITR